MVKKGKKMKNFTNKVKAIGFFLGLLSIGQVMAAPLFVRNSIPNIGFNIAVEAQCCSDNIQWSSSSLPGGKLMQQGGDNRLQIGNTTCPYINWGSVKLIVTNKNNQTKTIDLTNQMYDPRYNNYIIFSGNADKVQVQTAQASKYRNVTTLSPADYQ
jgi:hypothetical protein